MTSAPSPSDTAKRLFLQALEIEGPERVEFLAKLKTENAATHARVAQLLDAHTRAERASEAAAADGASALGLELPARLGHYELLGEIAAGGAGVVYRAHQVDLDRTVAIKLLRAGQLASDDEVRRFRAEAETAGRLVHPDIVPIYEVGTHEGRHFISMRLVEGTSLDQCREAYRDARKAARLVARIAHAVDHAHRHGVLHRDLKPANILIDVDGAPVVADFGTAKRLDGGDGLTLTGAVIGTPTYMAPEQASGCDVTVATDVYALGCILFELLTGRPPFAGDSLVEVLRRVREDAPPPLRSLRPELPRDLATICHTCLHKETARRYASALELARDLERWLAREPIAARPTTVLERLVLMARRKPVISSLTAAVLVLLVVVVVGSILFGLELQQRLEETEAAEADAREQLRNALVAETRLRRQSGRVGARVQGLDRLRRAAAIRPGPELVREAIACLGVTDLARCQGWPEASKAYRSVGFDHTFERAVLGRKDGSVEVRSVRDWSLLFTIEDDRRVAYTPRFSHDGRYLAFNRIGAPGSGMTSGFAVWDLERRIPVYSLDAPPGLGGTDFAPDRPAFLQLAPDGRLFERDLQSGVERTIHLFTGRFRPSIARYAPDGTRIAVTGQPPESARVLTGDGEEVARIGDPRPGCISVAWSPRGKRLITADDDRVARVWDVASRKLVCTLMGHQADLDWVSFVRKDLVATYAWDQTTRFWHVPTGEQTLLAECQILQLCADGKRLGVKTHDEILVLELVHEDVLETRQVDAGRIDAVDLSPDGRFAACIALKKLAILDLVTGRRHDVPAAGEPNGAVFTAGDTLWVAADSLECVTLDGGRPTGPRKTILDAKCHDLERNAHGDTIVMRTHDTILVHFPGSGRPAVRIPRPLGATRLAVSKGGEWVASGAWHGNGVHVWRTADGKLVAHLAQGEIDCRPEFSPDGTRLAVGLKRKYTIHRTGSWRLETTVRRRTGESPAMITRFSPDGRLLVASVETFNIGLVDAATAEELAVFQTRGIHLPTAGRVTAQGKLVIATGDGKLLSWDLTRLGEGLSRAGILPAGEHWAVGQLARQWTR